jgi:LysR family transcriptional regulator for metE and metH
MTFDLQDLELVQRIHEEGTLTGAAQRLFISQPALSRRLAKLERRLGSALFRRHVTGMTVTPEGERMLESAKRILGEVRRTEDDIRRLAQGYGGTLRVTTECYMVYHWLPEAARRFRRRCPGVEVDLVPDATRNPYEAMTRGAVDVAVVYSDPPDPAGVTLEPLFDDELVAVLAAGHPLARAPCLEPASFRGETLICHYSEPGHGVVERTFFEPAGIGPGRVMEMQVTPAVLEMARAGYGVAVLPRWILTAQASRDGLVVRPLGRDGLTRTWYAAHERIRADEPALRGLIEALMESAPMSC